MRIATLLVLGLLPNAIRSSESAPLQDPKEAVRKVVLLGNGLIEQDQSSGYMELALTLRSADRRVVCRNLGWSGDTVWGQARTKGYQNPGGFERLMKQTTEEKPDLILVGYGMVESFKGESGLKAFTEGYGKLLDSLGGLTPNLVLLSPAFHENLGPPLPDPADHNRNLELYSRVIETLARDRKLSFVDLFHPLQAFARAHPDLHLTTNGILLNDVGYWLAASEIRRQSGISSEPWRVALGPPRELKEAVGVKVTDLIENAEGVKFQVMEDLPFPPPLTSAVRALHLPSPLLQVEGLREGEWTLRIDGAEILSAPAQKWKEGVSVGERPSVRQAEELRQALVRENQFFARRWNPINDWPAHYTYIAPDFALYDSLLAAQEEKIAILAKTVPHVYQLTPRKP